MSATTLLVVNGDAAAGALEAAGLAGEGLPPHHAAANAERPLVVLRDVLSCGSLRHAALTRDLQAWRRVREAFWRRVWADGRRWGWVEEPFGAVGRLPANLYREAEAVEKADTVIACVGAGLSDQLMLAFLVAWFEHLEQDEGRLHIAAYLEPGRAADEAPPAGLGHLAPEELATGWSPRPLGAAERRELGAFWKDYGSAKDGGGKPWAPPEEALGQGAPDSLLSAARSAWASRAAAPPDHLAAWDRALLQAMSLEARPLRAVLGRALRAPAVQCDPVGDLVLLHRIVMMSDPSRGAPWWRLGACAGAETPCALTAYGASLLRSGTRAAADSRTSDWLRGMASVD